ncbi:MAG: MBL fold metallo-hydrolase [Pseudomonadota bacterium]
MEVTVLMDNDTAPGAAGIVAEHGLSYMVETPGGTVLFDTGVSGAFADNAAVLGKDLSAVTAAVISHHHFDHTGGLDRFFEKNDQATVYLKNGPSGNCQFRGLGFLRKNIGMNPGTVNRFENRFQTIDTMTEILPDVFLLTDIAAPYPKPGGNRYLFVVQDGRCRPDDFQHELIMVVRQNGALSVFTGCAHSGVLNMLATVQKQFPGAPIATAFGGFHLVGLPMFNSMAGSATEVADIGRQLMAMTAGRVYTGHCTGKKAYGVLKRTMGDRLAYFGAGACVQV